MTPPYAAYALAPASDLPLSGGVMALALVALAFLLVPSVSWAETAATIETPPALPPPDTGPPALAKDTQPRFFIREFRVDGGGKILSLDDVETAVYPYLGPYRTAADVEGARAALEQAYHDKGYQTVTVSIPRQPRSSIIHLAVSQGEVGRLNVTGSRYFSIEEIKREVPSLQEGASPNFSQVNHDLVAINQLADRRVTPVVRAGEIPGTVDVDLQVKDTFPLHGSLELNNRYSANTTKLRVNGSVDYDNLWQLGHSAGFSFQLAPEDTNQVQVYSGYYLARVPGLDWLSLEVQGTDQDSNVNTLGGIGVAGKGQIIGGRAIITLPPLSNYYQSISLGLDYKHFNQDLMIAGEPSKSPVTYYPFSAAYSGSWIGKGYETDVNASVNFSVRGFDGPSEEFDTNRFGADGGFIYIRGDLSHTRDLPGDAQFFGKIQGQAANKPLVNSEQFSAGGLGTVRGYLEAENLGDNGLIGDFEMRTPSLGNFIGKSVDEWRFYVFGDSAVVTLNDALPEQHENFTMASVGGGTRVKLQDHYNGSFDFGVPLVNSVDTCALHTRFTFRVWAEF